MQTLITRLSAVLGLNRLSVSQKLLTLTLLFLVVVTLMIVDTVTTLNTQKSDGAVINIAGRQRMLTQKFTKEFFLALQQAQHQAAGGGLQAIDLGRMTQTGRLFEDSLKALKSGGTTYLDLQMNKPVVLPAPENPQIVAKLNEVETLWQQLQSEIERVGTADYDPAQLTALNDLSIQVLATMNQAVGMFAGDSDSKVQTMLDHQTWIWLFAVVASSLTAWIIARNITTPLDQVIRASARIAEGDLKTYASQQSSRDELGTLMTQVNNMRSVLSGIIHTVQQNSKQMTHSSFRIATISKEISAISAQEQQGSERVLAATDSLQEMAGRVNEQVLRTNDTAAQTQAIADQGVTVVEQSIAELTSAVDIVNTTAERMGSVKDATDQIHVIIESINNIAAQTNLLALNAAIEAARAGEHGRGFAVVADEVRSLASRTADSTTEITTLIETLTTQVDGSVRSMQQVTEQVHHSQEQSQQTLEAFDAMTQGINRNNDNVSQIASLNQQQVEQLGSLQSELSQLFEILATSAEKAGSTSLVAGDLHEISDTLEQLLNEFATDTVAEQPREANEKRAYPRINNQLKVVLQQGEHTVEGLTQDLSMTGLQMRCLQPLQLDPKQPLSAILDIPEQHRRGGLTTLTIPCRLIHQGQLKNGHHYGISFDDQEVDQQQLASVFSYFAKASHFAGTESRPAFSAR